MDFGSVIFFSVIRILCYSAAFMAFNGFFHVVFGTFGYDGFTFGGGSSIASGAGTTVADGFAVYCMATNGYARFEGVSYLAGLHLAGGFFLGF